MMLKRVGAGCGRFVRVERMIERGMIGMVCSILYYRVKGWSV